MEIYSSLRWGKVSRGGRYACAWGEATNSRWCGELVRSPVISHPSRVAAGRTLKRGGVRLAENLTNVVPPVNADIPSAIQIHFVDAFDPHASPTKQAFIGRPTKGLLRFLNGGSFCAKTGKVTFRNDA
jgi:hypothetical protein